MRRPARGSFCGRWSTRRPRRASRGASAPRLQLRRVEGGGGSRTSAAGTAGAGTAGAAGSDSAARPSTSTGSCAALSDCYVPACLSAKPEGDPDHVAVETWTMGSVDDGHLCDMMEVLGDPSGGAVVPGPRFFETGAPGQAGGALDGDGVGITMVQPAGRGVFNAVTVGSPSDNGGRAFVPLAEFLAAGWTDDPAVVCAEICTAVERCEVFTVTDGPDAVAATGGPVCELWVELGEWAVPERIDYEGVVGWASGVPTSSRTFHCPSSGARASLGSLSVVLDHPETRGILAATGRKVGVPSRLRAARATRRAGRGTRPATGRPRPFRSGRRRGS